MFPKSFWGEAVNTAVYLINRSLSIHLDFDISQRVWTGKDVSYSHLKVFRCKTFMHVSKEQRLKLDDKAIPCIFVGYGDEEFDYKFWDLEKQKIVRSRDVVFHKHNTMEENVRGTKFRFEGVVDLTPIQISSESITDDARIPKSEQGIEIEEPVIQEEENEDDDGIGGLDQGEHMSPQEGPLSDT